MFAAPMAQEFNSNAYLGNHGAPSVGDVNNHHANYQWNEGSHHPQQYNSGYPQQYHDQYRHHDYDEYNAAPAAQQQHHQYAHPYPQQQTSFCVACGCQPVPYPGAACSRRCDWVARGCCPQCGRATPRAMMGAAMNHHHNQHGQQLITFCSGACACEARQANWCVGCGVRQLGHGMASCGSVACAAAVQRIAARVQHHHHHQQAPASSSRGPSVLNHSTNSNSTSGSSFSAAAAAGGAVAVRGRRRFEPHTVLPANDKQNGALKQQLGAELSRRIAGIVKVGGSSDSRKAYTAYRSRVEGDLNDVCGIGAPKYGHGGEGNEHRRYLALTSTCGRALVDGANGNGEVRPCSDSKCQVCNFMEHGNAAIAQRQLVPTFTSAAAAVDAVKKAASPALIAVVACRVTVGNPRIVHSDAAEASAVLAPDLVQKIHATVVQHAAFDVAYVPAEVASVDPLFVVLLGVDA